MPRDCYVALPRDAIGLSAVCECGVDNMKELFQDIHIDSIMTFLRQINLFNKI